MNRLLKSLLLLFLLLITSKSFAQDKIREEYLKSFNERREWFISHYDTMSRTHYSAIAAKYYRNKDVKQADEMFLQLLKKPSGAMFWMFPVVNCYMVGKD